ncbi:glycosyltransferase [Winogradskyella haliclonae]|uniref:Glycosyl transferase n=1 Tax=Winogradskyella haliclonae TaxID=2048558 RepID=A0ABQ2C1H0_9FLAO|nr:glycosyltransferase [Winogradskyella haliclonae]GGI58036.1 glycosyl transferase [Winogradskyella haliclonae]
MQSNRNPVVSICMITYNHEAYIAQAILSVIEQKTDFNFELVISNDCSTDSTNTVIETVIKQNTNSRLSIRYYNQSSNLGMMPNFIFTLDSCTGKYVALLEGDDFWTDPLKLQKQVDFLGKNKDCSFCFHKAYLVSETGEITSDTHIYPEDIKANTLNASKYLALNSSATCSLMYRSIEIKSIKRMHHSHGDFMLYCELLHHGKAGFLDSVMSAYRKHDFGVSNKLNSEAYMRNRINELKTELNYFKSKAVVDGIRKKYLLKLFKFLKLHGHKISDSEKKEILNQLRKSKLYYNLKFKNLFKRLLRKMKIH